MIPLIVLIALLWLACVVILARWPTTPHSHPKHIRDKHILDLAREGFICIPVCLGVTLFLNFGAGRLLIASLWLWCIYMLMRSPPQMGQSETKQERAVRKRRWARQGAVGISAGLEVYLLINWQIETSVWIAVVGLWLWCIYILMRRPETGLSDAEQKHAARKRRWALRGFVGGLAGFAAYLLIVQQAERNVWITVVSLGLWLWCIYILMRRPQTELSEIRQEHAARKRRWARRGGLGIPASLGVYLLIYQRASLSDWITVVSVGLWLWCLYISMLIPQTGQSEVEQKRTERQQRRARRGILIVPVVFTLFKLIEWHIVSSFWIAVSILGTWLGCLYVLTRTSNIGLSPEEQARQARWRFWAQCGAIIIPACFLGLLFFTMIMAEMTLTKATFVVIVIGLWLVCFYLLILTPRRGLSAKQQATAQHRRRWAHIGLVGIPIGALTFTVLANVSLTSGREYHYSWPQPIIILLGVWLGFIYASIFVGIRWLWCRLGASGPHPLRAIEKIPLVGLVGIPLLIAVGTYYLSDQIIYKMSMVLIGIYPFIILHLLRRPKRHNLNQGSQSRVYRMRSFFLIWIRRVTLILLSIGAVVCLFAGWRAVDYYFAGNQFIWVARSGFGGLVCLCLLWLIDGRIPIRGAWKFFFFLTRSAEHGILIAVLIVIIGCCVYRYYEHNKMMSDGIFECVLEGPSMSDGLSERDDVSIAQGIDNIFAESAALGNGIIFTSIITDKNDTRYRLAAMDFISAINRSKSPDEQQDLVNRSFHSIYGSDVIDPDMESAKNNIGCLMISKRIDNDQIDDKTAKIAKDYLNQENQGKYDDFDKIWRTKSARAKILSRKSELGYILPYGYIELALRQSLSAFAGFLHHNTIVQVYQSEYLFSQFYSYLSQAIVRGEIANRSAHELFQQTLSTPRPRVNAVYDSHSVTVQLKCIVDLSSGRPRLVACPILTPARLFLSRNTQSGSELDLQICGDDIKAFKDIKDDDDSIYITYGILRSEFPPRIAPLYKFNDISYITEENSACEDKKDEGLVVHDLFNQLHPSFVIYYAIVAINKDDVQEIPEPEWDSCSPKVHIVCTGWPQ